MSEEKKKIVEDNAIGPLPSEVEEAVTGVNMVPASVAQKRKTGGGTHVAPKGPLCFDIEGDDDDTVGPLAKEMEASSYGLPPKKRVKQKGNSEGLFW